MPQFRPVTHFNQTVASVILAAIIVMASSFHYFFIGQMPIWLVLGAVGLGYSFLCGQMQGAWELSAGLRRIVGVWFMLILTTGVLDLFSYIPRDLMSGPVLNLLTMNAFLGAFTLATFADNLRVVKTVIAVTLFQALLAIAQFYGSEVAWRFPDLVSDLLQVARVEYGDVFDLSVMSFDQVGRVRGSVPHVHIFGQIQSVLVAFCIAAMLGKGDIQLRSWLFIMLGWLSIVLGGISLFLTFSRSAILILIVSIFLILITNPKPFRILAAFIAAVGTFILLIYIGLSDSAQFARLLMPFDEGLSNLQRFEQYDLAWQNFSNNPLVGASGPNAYGNLTLPIHSVPLRYLNDYGLLGFVLYIFLFGGFTALFVKRLKSPNSIIASWAACGLVQLLVIIMDNWTHSSGLLRRDVLHAVMLGFVAGAMLSAERRAALGRASLKRSVPVQLIRSYRV